MKYAGNWDRVIDFKWHRNIASPNWTVIPKEERVKELLIAGTTWRVCPEEINEAAKDSIVGTET